MHCSISLPVLPRRLADGTFVRVAGQRGSFRIVSVAAWGGPSSDIVTHYNLQSSGGTRLAAVSVTGFQALSERKELEKELSG